MHLEAIFIAFWKISESWNPAVAWKVPPTHTHTHKRMRANLVVVVDIFIGLIPFSQVLGNGSVFGHFSFEPFKVYDHQLHYMLPVPCAVNFQCFFFCLEGWRCTKIVLYWLTLHTGAMQQGKEVGSRADQLESMSQTLQLVSVKKSMAHNKVGN